MMVTATASGEPPIANTAPAQKYQRCMVMAGGGFRFGIYLGMYAAACDAGQPPDVILASCGGAIAAGAIARLPDPQATKAWLLSPELYQFWKSFGANPQAPLSYALRGVLRRYLARSPAPHIPDVFGDYLFVPPTHSALPDASSAIPALRTSHTSHTSHTSRPDIAIVGSRVLFQPHEVGAPRGTRKLFEETIFCQDPCAALLDAMPAPLGSLPHSSVAQQVRTHRTMPLEQAVRISVTDMVYFAAVPVPVTVPTVPVITDTTQSTAHSPQSTTEHYFGGVVDLFPIELAKRLAHSVTMECKAPFNQTSAVPAWRSVLGVNANQRLQHVHAQEGIHWIDTSDIETALPTQAVRWHLDWLRNRIYLHPPTTHTDYIHHMTAQWNYGYQRTQESLTPQARTPRSMRVVGRYDGVG